jgi:hypothetical protein
VKNIDKLKTRVDNLVVETRTTLAASMAGMSTDDLESKPLIRGADGEFDDTKGLKNRQLMTKSKDMLKN